MSLRNQDKGYIEYIIFLFAFILILMGAGAMHKYEKVQVEEIKDKETIESPEKISVIKYQEKKNNNIRPIYNKIYHYKGNGNIKSDKDLIEYNYVFTPKRIFKRITVLNGIQEDVIFKGDAQYQKVGNVYKYSDIEGDESLFPDNGEIIIMKSKNILTIYNLKVPIEYKVEKMVGMKPGSAITDSMVTLSLMKGGKYEKNGKEYQ